MSESFSRIIYPFEIARRPSIEPEVRRAILARWSSNATKVSEKRPTLGRESNRTRRSEREYT